MKFLIVFPLTIMLLASCKQEKEEQTHIDLYVRYEADTRKMLAEASFFREGENGKIMQFDPSGGVAFLGSNMDKRELPGGKVRYSYDNKIEMPISLSLAWNGPDNSKSTVSFEAVQIDNFQLVKENENFTMNFSGPPLAKEETMVLLFTDTDRKMINKEIKGPTSSSSISISINELEGLSQGKGQLSLARTKTFSKAGNGFDCRITFAYYSNALEVNL